MEKRRAAKSRTYAYYSRLDIFPRRQFDQPIRLSENFPPQHFSALWRSGLSGLGHRLWLINRYIISRIITTHVCLILETAKALKRIRFFAKAVTFTDSESEGYTAPSLNDLYGHIIDPNSHPCNKLEKTESKEPTPSQFLIGVCFNKCTEPTNHKEKSPKTPVKKETRAKRNVAVRKKGK